MQPLDELDRQLIGALRENSRASVAALAELLGVTRATVTKRMERLVSSGAILAFTIRVQQEFDANAIRAVMLIEVSGRATNAIIKRLRGMPEITAIHTTNGAWDLVAELRTETLQDFDRVLRQVRSADGVLNSETSILLSSLSG